MTTEEIIKSFIIDRKVTNIGALKKMVKDFKKEARDRSMPVDYRRLYKRLVKLTRANLREEQAELHRLKTT